MGIYGYNLVISLSRIIKYVIFNPVPDMGIYGYLSILENAIKFNLARV